MGAMIYCDMRNQLYWWLHEWWCWLTLQWLLGSRRELGLERVSGANDEVPSRRSSYLALRTDGSMAAAAPGERYILRGILNLYPLNKSTYTVTLTHKHVEIAPPEGACGRLTIALRDVVGCDCMRGRDAADATSYLTIYAYPYKKKWTSQSKVRSRQTVTLAFDKAATYRDNVRVAHLWRLAIRGLIRGEQITTGSDLQGLELGKRPHLFVFVNPFSGQGRALQVFQQRVVPLLVEAGIRYTSCVTKYAGHAGDIMRSMSLDNCDGILICSGDGLIFEVVNALMGRPDWEHAIRTPLGVVPGGSGNALACSINHYCGEPFLDQFVLHSSFIVAKHRVEPLDLVAVDTADKRFYSFLSVTWGLTADVDIESERYRSLGSARFFIGTIHRIMMLRKYYGRLSFLPIEGEVFKPRSRRAGPDYIRHSVSMGFTDRALYDSADRTRCDSNPFPHSRSTDFCGRPRAYSERGHEVLDVCRHCADDALVSRDGGGGIVAASRCECSNIDIVLATPESESGFCSSSLCASSCDASGSDAALINNNWHRAGSEGSEQSEPSTSDSGSSARRDSDESPAADLAPGPPSPLDTPLLAPLSQPVPEGWTIIEDEFLLVQAVTQTHICAEAFCAPTAKPSDGVIDLQFMRGGTSKLDILSFFVQLESGTHFNNPSFEHVRVKAFRLEPLSPDTTVGNISVDGERIPYGPVQAQILPGIARVMVS